MNLVVFKGRLSRDVELRYTPNNKAVAQFNIAVRRKYAKETDEITADFFNVIIWGKQAENCKTYLHKGSQVNVIGELRTRNYEDRDGIKRYVTEVLASSVEFLDSKSKENDVEDTTIPEPPVEEREQASLYDEDYISQINDDDLPF